MQSQPGGTEKEHQQFASEHSKRTAFSYKPCVCVYGAIIEVRSGVGEKQQTMDTRLNTMTVVNELFCSTAEFYLLIICNFTWLCVGECTVYEANVRNVHYYYSLNWSCIVDVVASSFCICSCLHSSWTCLLSTFIGAAISSNSRLCAMVTVKSHCRRRTRCWTKLNTTCAILLKWMFLLAAATYFYITAPIRLCNIFVCTNKQVHEQVSNLYILLICGGC